MTSKKPVLKAVRTTAKSPAVVAARAAIAKDAARLAPPVAVAAVAGGAKTASTMGRVMGRLVADVQAAAAAGQGTVTRLQPAADAGKRQYSHYFRDVAHLQVVDVYRVLHLFGVTDQAIGHAIKKLLVAGGRGSKVAATDVAEAIATLQRWQEMRSEDGGGLAP